MADDPSKRASFSRLGISFGVLLQSICVVFLVGAANYIGFNYYRHWDFSRSKKFTLADQTEAELRMLKSPLKIIDYFSASSLGPDVALREDVQNLLAQLSFSARAGQRNVDIDIRTVDPSRDPSTATEMQEKYKFDGLQNVLILDYNGRSKILPIFDLGDFDMSGIQTGQPPVLQEFNGEAVIASALLQLIDPDKAKIYFVRGHGETPPEKVTFLTDALSRENVEALSINLGTIEKVPDDASAVCIMGAQYDLSDTELQVLENYWAGKGRMVVLLDPSTNVPNRPNMPNLLKLLNDTGIFPRNDRVQRLARSDSRPDLITLFPFVQGIFLQDNAITRRLVGANIRLPGATDSLFLDDVGAGKKDVQLRPLIQAIEGYWGEVHYDDRTKIGLEYNDGEDTGDPIIVAASAEKGAAKDDRTDVAISRLVVVSNSAFIQDDSVRQTPINLDFMLSVFDRMIDGRIKLVGVAPKSARSFALGLTEEQIGGIALYTLIVIPAAVALLGLIVGLRRRS